VETAWQGPARQLEEAWFLGLRLNAGVDVPSLEQEFGVEMVAPAMGALERLVEDGLLMWDSNTVRLTAQGRLISNDVFQEFLVPGLEEDSAGLKAQTIAGWRRK
jgi:oxygen-independent coproporphyrinogen-3 oxidase